MTLIEFKKARNLSNTKLAEMLGVHEVTVSRYLHRKTLPDTLTMDRIRQVSGGLVDTKDCIPEKPSTVHDAPAEG